MDKPDLLLVGPLMPSVVDALAERFVLHRLWEAEDRDALLADLAPRVRAAATNGAVGCSGAVMERLPRLEVLACFGVGVDAIDLATARARGVRVTNTPDVLNDAVAELALALMLALCRRIVPADSYVRAGRWTGFGAYPLTDELTGKTVGIVGLGRIGREIARRCQAFRMQVVYHGRRRQPHEPYPFFADLAEMARAADWLVVVAPGGAGTHHMVDRAVLEALGPEGALVNVGRGTSVDEAALVACLEAGRLGGAALDVYEDEPRVPDALKTMENVVLSPHQGSATRKTRRAMGELVVANLDAFLNGDPLPTPVV